MNKHITISPDTMLALLGGARLRPIDVAAARNARVVKCGYSQQTNEFTVEIASDSFEHPELRLPQEWHLEIQK